jgi:hypothetical protein
MTPKGKHHDRCHEHEGEDQETEGFLFSEELIDQLLVLIQNWNAEAILGESGLAGQLKKQLAKRILAVELSHHPTTEAGEKRPRRQPPQRAPVPRLSCPPMAHWNWSPSHNRPATFASQPVAKYRHRLRGSDDYVIGMSLPGALFPLPRTCPALF